MTFAGVRVPPVVNRRPRLELRGSSATPEEAAAVIAAVEQFLRDTAPPPADEPTPSQWVQTARREAVDRQPNP
ncbi:MAG: hypothetical protein ACREIV_09440 [Planctomycetaceae bacterium]